MGPNTWSQRLSKLVNKKGEEHEDLERGISSSKHPVLKDEDSRLPIVLVDGPYGEPMYEPGQYSHLILVGGGVGVTPMISLLGEQLHRLEREMAGSEGSCALETITLIWTTRDPYAFDWFAPMMNKIRRAAGLKNIVFLRLHCTKPIDATRIPKPGERAVSRQITRAPLPNRRDFSTNNPGTRAYSKSVRASSRVGNWGRSRPQAAKFTDDIGRPRKENLDRRNGLRGKRGRRSRFNSSFGVGQESSRGLVDSGYEMFKTPSDDFKTPSMFKSTSSKRGYVDDSDYSSSDGEESDDYAYPDRQMTWVDVKAAKNPGRALGLPDFEIGRPDMLSIFRSVTNMAISTHSERVAVYVCGPDPLVKSCEDNADIANKSNPDVTIDVHSETFLF